MADLAKLVASLEVETARYQRNLDKANKKLDRFSKNQNRRLDKIKAGFKKLALGVTAFGATATLIFNRTVKELDDIAKAARTAGIGAEVFQAWELAATEAGVSTAKFRSGLERATKRIGEAADGTGAGKDVLEKYNIALRNTDGTIRSTEAIVRDFADKLRGASSQAEIAAASSDLFGRENVKLGQLLLKGNAALEEYERTARDLGIVISEDVLGASERFNDSLGRLQKIFQAGIAKRVGALAPELTKISNALVVFTSKSREASTAGSGFGQVVNLLAQSSIAVAGAFEKLGTRIGAISAALVKAAQLDFEAVRNINEQAAEDIASIQSRIDRAIRDLRSDVQPIIIPVIPKRLPPSASASGSQIKEIEIPTIERRDFNRSEVNQSVVDQALANAKEFEDKLRDRQQPIADVVSGAINRGAVDGAQGMVQSLLSALQRQFLSQAANLIAKSLAGSSSGGFFAALFGGARAEGGPVSPGRAFLVGEQGPELFVPGSKGNIVPNGGMGGNVFNIDARGAVPGVEQRIKAAVGEAVALSRADRIESRRRARP